MQPRLRIPPPDPPFKKGEIKKTRRNTIKGGKKAAQEPFSASVDSNLIGSPADS
jgi:hypothetical protein